MGILIGLLVGAFAIAAIHENGGKWYEYAVAIILTLIVCIGFCLV